MYILPLNAFATVLVETAPDTSCKNLGENDTVGVFCKVTA